VPGIIVAIYPSLGFYEELYNAKLASDISEANLRMHNSRNRRKLRRKKLRVIQIARDITIGRNLHGAPKLLFGANPERNLRGAAKLLAVLLSQEFFGALHDSAVLDESLRLGNREASRYNDC